MLPVKTVFNGYQKNYRWVLIRVHVKSFRTFKAIYYLSNKTHYKPTIILINVNLQHHLSKYKLK